MQNIAAFVQQVRSSTEEPEGGETGTFSADCDHHADPKSYVPSDGFSAARGTTFSIGGAADASATSRSSFIAGRGGKASGGLSRNISASSDDDAEASVARLNLCSPKSKKVTVDRKLQAKPSKQQQSEHLQPQLQPHQRDTQNNQERHQRQLQHDSRQKQYPHEGQHGDQQQLKPQLQHTSQLESPVSGVTLSTSEYSVEASKPQRGQDQADKAKESTASSSGNKQRAGSEAQSQASCSAAPVNTQRESEYPKPKQSQQDGRPKQASKDKPEQQSTVRTGKSAIALESVSEIVYLPGEFLGALQVLSEDCQTSPKFEPTLLTERQRRLVADRGAAASMEIPWLRDLTRPLSPFTQPDAMMKRNKDLAVR